MTALTSCATSQPFPPGHPARTVYGQIDIPIYRHDITHVVAPGETLWRLGKMYDVKVEDIMRANNIKSPQELEMGQRLLIPNAMPLRPVVPLYYSTKWNT
jgi:hypothetical protein